jgi:tetratricopeptide (TPR) repeat protein
VNQAIRVLDGGDATVAISTLEDYLSTGPCREGSIGTPDPLKRRPNGGFDLGLSLFKLGETFGRRFGEEELDGGLDEKTKALRGEQIACALRVLSAIESYGLSPTTPAELLARAHYLDGNLNFLDRHYEEAVAAYDKALTLAPGEPDGGDPVGRDAAWNRAIAMRRIDDQKDAGADSGSEGGRDAGGDSGSDGKDGGNHSGNDSGGGDSGGDSDQSPDAGAMDAGQPPPDKEPDAGPPPPPRANEDDRMLDQLESAPTVQQEAAKKMAAHHKVRGMADK